MSESRIRLYDRKLDEEQMFELFRKQGLTVDLPLPGHDPAVVCAYVLEMDGKIRHAIIMRMTAEAHLVTDVDLASSAREIINLRRETEGGLLLRSKDLQDMRHGAITDVNAQVPADNPEMLALMEHLGFQPEPEGFKYFWRRLGSYR